MRLLWFSASFGKGSKPLCRVNRTVYYDLKQLGSKYNQEFYLSSLSLLNFHLVVSRQLYLLGETGVSGEQRKPPPNQESLENS